MQLYSGPSSEFIEHAIQNDIADRLRNAFVSYFRFEPNPSEVSSWRNSLSKVKDVLQRADLTDHGVILEYQLPLSSKRLDFLISGKNKAAQDNAVIIELKQWEGCEAARGDNEVATWLGKNNRLVLHPSVQVGRYHSYLQDSHTAFYDGDNPIQLNACSYLHNYNLQKRDPLLSGKFKEAVTTYPLFAASDVDRLCSYLSGFVGSGKGLPILERIEKSQFRASKKLMDHVAKIIDSNREFVLLDEQVVVFDQVLALAREPLKKGKKSVVLVKGGPGTGKSLIAINLMAELSRLGLQTHYATGSRAFTETLWDKVGTRARPLFKYFNNYAMAHENDLDVLILDESHRIRKNSVSQYTPKDQRSGLPQIDELVKAAKVTVFFIDDYQVVKPGEVGTSSLIQETAARRNCSFEEYQLEAQFRCEGSEGFVNWIDNTLGIRKTANTLWNSDTTFDFKIFDSPVTLEQAIRKKAAEGYLGRLTAGYCWTWSRPKTDGTLVDDVVIDDFKMPWNARPNAGRLAPGIPKAQLWATHPNGMNQIGCVYTAQGFEFDYVGVIFGKDIVYEPVKGCWEGHPDESHDNFGKAPNFDALVKNTYRVLLSRGIKGCYVYFMDEATRNFFMSRIEGDVNATTAEFALDDVPIGKPAIFPDIPANQQYVTHLPIFSLAAAAGGFSDTQDIRPLGWTPISDGRKLHKNLFVAKVKGRSMEPTIPDGSYCIFHTEPAGTRNGQIVLVQSNQISDPETGGRYTVKKYRSEKKFDPNGTWIHKEITLSPINREFPDIVLVNVEPETFRVVAQFISVLR